MGNFRQVLTCLDEKGLPKNWICVLCKETSTSVRDIHMHLTTHKELEYVEKVDLIVQLKFYEGGLWKHAASHLFRQDLKDEVTDCNHHEKETEETSLRQSPKDLYTNEELEFQQIDFKNEVSESDVTEYASDSEKRTFSNDDQSYSESSETSNSLKSEQSLLGQDNHNKGCKLQVPEKRKLTKDKAKQHKNEEPLSKKSKSIPINDVRSNEESDNQGVPGMSTEQGKQRRRTKKLKKTSKVKKETLKAVKSQAKKENIRKKCDTERPQKLYEQCNSEEECLVILAKHHQKESNTSLGVIGNISSSNIINTANNVQCSVISVSDFTPIKENNGLTENIPTEVSFKPIMSKAGYKNDVEKSQILSEKHELSLASGNRYCEKESRMDCKFGSSHLETTKSNQNSYDNNIRKQKEQYSEKVYQCNDCSYRTKYSGAFYRHEKIHSGKLKCTLCERMFTALCDLKLHIQCQHEKEFLFCDQCEKKFTSRHGLYEHVRHDHKQNFRYKCNHCDHKGFRNRSHLIGHMNQKHFKLRPYQCNPCGKTFTYKWHLTKHLEKCKGPKVQILEEANNVISCKYCEKMFTSKAILKVHMKCKHDTEDSTYVCVCGKSYKWPGSFSRHKRKCSIYKDKVMFKHGNNLELENNAQNITGLNKGKDDGNAEEIIYTDETIVNSTEHVLAQIDQVPDNSAVNNSFINNNVNIENLDNNITLQNINECHSENNSQRVCLRGLLTGIHHSVISDQSCIQTMKSTAEGNFT